MMTDHTPTDGRCIRCPDWTQWEADLRKAATKDAEPISDEELDRFRHALADVHCKSSSRERDEVEYRLQRFGAKMWRKILARLDRAEARTPPVEQGDLVERVARMVELAIIRHGVDECALEGTLDDAEEIIASVTNGDENARLRSTLQKCREAIASLPEDGLGMALPGFGIPGRDEYPIRDELLTEIDEALAPKDQRA